MKGILPKTLRSVFWSYNFSALDTENDKRLIVSQIINYGTWKNWQWLVRHYGLSEIKKTLEDIPRTAFRPGALKLISLLLSISPPYASRSDYVRR